MNIEALYELHTKLKKYNSNTIYELTNCIERWAIAKLNDLSDADEKLREELYEKLKNFSSKDIGYVLDFTKVAPKKDYEFLHRTGMEGYIIIDGLKVGGKAAAIEVTDRMRNIILNFGRDELFKLIQRYLPLMVSISEKYDKVVYDFAGQHWTVSKEFGDDLYKKYNILNEAFASPFNSHSLGREVCKYYSLFDEDDNVGSLGNFFSISNYDKLPPGNWMVNPPYIESIMIKMADKVIEMYNHCNAKGIPILFYIILPRWEDCEALIKLDKVAKTKEDVFFPFVNHKGELIKKTFNARYYIL
jgi:hypothetical protein